ncbi:MAG: patatin-like phospholipase family protein [Anaerolineales bacterium]
MMDISLALGGGGSRGYAHIGVLRCLENEGFRIRAVAGTSAGGIVAIAYASGYTPDEMEAIFSKVDQSKLFARSPNEGPGILGFSGAAKLFEELFGKRTFADLRIPCAVVAVDLKVGREITLDQGWVVDAILATAAVPGVFPPKQLGDLQLVDGAVLNPVPVSVARLLAPSLPVVAVILDVDGSPSSFNNLPLPVPVPAPIVERLTRTRVAQAFNIFLQSVDVSSRSLSELRLLTDNPDIVIRPDVCGIGILDKVDIHSVVRKGEKATEFVIPDLHRAVAWPKRLQRRVFTRR